jgi:hypothetical protein
MLHESGMSAISVFQVKFNVEFPSRPKPVKAKQIFTFCTALSARPEEAAWAPCVSRRFHAKLLASLANQHAIRYFINPDKTLLVY